MNLRKPNPLRLLPVVALAAGALLFLKAVGFLAEPPSLSQRSARAETADDAPIITGSTPQPAAPAAQPQAPASPARSNAGVTPIPPVGAPPPPSVSPAERAILERLQERRGELDTRARELEIRENLIRAAERRLEQRAQELRELEGRIAALETKRDEAEQQRFRGVVSMYEQMRARDAARIFDGLEPAVLIEVARAMRPPKLADVMAQMQPDNAKRLTIELARKPGQAPREAALPEARPGAPQELPKIEGRPIR